MGATGDKGDQVANELKVHLNALKGYVDMKFNVLKSMMAGKKGGKEESTKQLEQLRSELQSSMMSMSQA